MKKLSHKDPALRRSLGMAVLVLVPLGIMGNLSSQFVKNGDWLHLVFCLVAVACQLGLYFVLWPVSRRPRQRQ